MAALSIRRHALGSLPALAVAAVVLTVWSYGRWGYLPAAERDAVADALTAGWLCILFLAATIACIVWAAAVPQSAASQGRLFFGFAFLIDICGLLLLLAALSPGALHLADIGAVYVLLAAWTAFITALTAALRPWGPGISAAVATTVAALLLSSPITLMPLVDAAGPAWQPRIVAVITHTCPLLALVDALRPTIRLDWGQLPQMYRYSGLGQSIPAEAGSWWACSLGYGLLALPLSLIARRRRRCGLASRTLDPPEDAPPPAAPSRPAAP